MKACVPVKTRTGVLTAAVSPTARTRNEPNGHQQASGSTHCGTSTEWGERNRPATDETQKKTMQSERQKGRHVLCDSAYITVENGKLVDSGRAVVISGAGGGS